MRKIQLALPFFFIFLFLFSVNARAFPLPVDYNVSLTEGANARGIRCTNSTIDNKIYCFIYNENLVYNHYFTRLNSTLGNVSTCSMDATYGTSYNCAVGAFAVLNESYIEFECGTAYCDMWDVSNITGGSCSLVQRNSSSQCGNFIENDFGQPAVQDVNIYVPSVTSTKNLIIDKDTFAKLADGYWDLTADWGYGSKHLLTISIPDRSNNNTIYVSTAGYYATASNKYPHSPFFVYQNGLYSQQVDSPATDFGICLNTTCWTDLIMNSTGSTWLFAFDRTNNRAYRGTLNLTSAYVTNCALNYTYPVGTVCDLSDSSNRIYQTYDGCNLTYDSCPSGSVCSQLTPQINVSTSLVEDYVSCEIVTGFGFHVNCFNICFGSSDMPVFSNCIDTGCKHCTINAGNYTGYNINKWYTNQTFVSVPSYTISCIDTTTGHAVSIIDNFGNETNETDLLTKAGNSVSEASPEGQCINTTTLCYDSVCNFVPCANLPTNDSLTALSSWINNSFGTSFATPLISFFVSACVSMYIFINVKEKKMETFIVPFLLILGGFSFITFFPLWLLLLMTIFTGVAIFWKAKG